MTKVQFDHTKRCRDCGSTGVVIWPKTGRPGKLCAACLLEAINEAILMGEAEEILTTGEIEDD